MKNTDRADVAQFIAALYCEKPNRGKLPGEIVPLAMSLMRAARQVAGLNLVWCNTGLSPAQEKRRERIKRDVLLFARQLGCKEVEISGDPRGAAIKLKMPSGRGNSWGGEGFYCVPEGR